MRKLLILEMAIAIFIVLTRRDLDAPNANYKLSLRKFLSLLSNISFFLTFFSCLLIFPENRARARARAISANSKRDVNNRGMEPNGTMIESVLFENSWRREATDPIVS
ncbi:hypothetical protein V1478_017730 [Vespula squamosa]|uniref:Uncharacterized protein n=1 Tax=Vespula squamosa TaxID=30214 RepID=A0ABD1ZZ80_VESSQ